MGSARARKAAIRRWMTASSARLSLPSGDAGSVKPTVASTMISAGFAPRPTVWFGSVAMAAPSDAG